MMLGKRGRPPMRRTTSMTRITVDLGTGSGSELSYYKPKIMVDEISDKEVIIYNSVVSPRYQRRISGEGFERERANFLTTCYLCNCRLAPQRYIYMYSMECREQQMKLDERKDKSNIKPIKTENHHNHSEFPSAKSETSSNSDTLAAA